jgi:hypothetical protein
MAARLLARPSGWAGLLASPLLAAQPAQFCRRIDGTTVRFPMATDQATGRVAEVLRHYLFPAERRGHESANNG